MLLKGRGITAVGQAEFAVALSFRAWSPGTSRPATLVVAGQFFIEALARLIGLGE